MEGFTKRMTTLDDYPILCEWWEFWRWKPVPQEVLPDEGRNGIMIQYKGENAIAGFIYATSSPVLFHLEWIVSNPNIKDKIVRKEAKQLLINSCSDIIKQAGGRFIYTSLKSESLINDFTDCGFEVGSKCSTEMIKVLL